MALINKKLTELDEKLSVSDDAWIHVVEPLDLTQSPQGSSYKAKKSTISGTVKAQSTVSGTVKTNSNSADPIVYLKSEVDALIVGKENALGFTPENIANKQNNLSVDITNTKYPTVSAVNLGLSDKATTADLLLKADKTSTYTKAEVDNLDAQVLIDANVYTDSKVTSLYKIMPSVANFASLPLIDNEVGDVRNVIDTGMNYVWDGVLWDALGSTVDISGKEDVANKQNSLAVDATNLKYPTVTAVNTGLALKANIASPTFTGTPTAPTATAGTNTTQIATTAFVLANSNRNIPYLSYEDSTKSIWNEGFYPSNNTVYGQRSLSLNSTGSNEVSLGWYALGNMTSGNGNIAVGSEAGLLITGGFQNQNSSESVFLGRNTRPNGTSQTNQIVIGSGAIGAGSNTATLGNTSITSTILRGAVSAGSFVKNSATSTNILLAGGTDITQASLPISTATQTALDGKLNLTGGTLTGTLNGTVADFSTHLLTDKIFSSALLGSIGNAQVINAVPGNLYIGNPGLNQLFLEFGGTSASFTASGISFPSSVTATSFNGSATLTGTPTAPTATAGTNTTQIATTAFVLANAGVGGSYTPTLTNISNTSSLTGVLSYYTNIGGIVTLTTRFNLTETSALTSTSFRVTLPVNRTTSNAKTIIGSGVILDVGTTGEKPARAGFDTSNNSSFIVTYRTNSSTGSTSGSITIQYSTAE